MPVFKGENHCLIRCDNCPAEYIGIHRDVRETIDAARMKKGWQERRIGDETQFFCSFCVDFVVGAA